MGMCYPAGMLFVCPQLGTGGFMPSKKRSFECSVVNETVSISLRNRRVGGFRGNDEPFVQCNQSDCQYVDANEHPCPLSLALFAHELSERKERARARRETNEAGY